MLAQLLFVVTGPLWVILSSSDCEADSKPESAAPEVEQDVEAILDEWQRREPKIERALVRFQQYEYDDVFAIEKRGEGELHFEPRQKYLWMLKPAEVEVGTVRARKTPSGSRFQVTAETAMTIFVDDHQVVVADPEQMTYNVVGIPPNIDLWTWEVLSPPKESPTGFWERAFGLLWYPSWIDLHASLLTGTNIEQMRETFVWSFSTKNHDGYISLTARAANAKQEAHFQQIDVLLDPDNYRTKGVRIIDPVGTRSTVLVPSYIEINGKVGPVKAPSFEGFTLARKTIQNTSQAQNNLAARNEEGVATLIVGALLLWMMIL